MRMGPITPQQAAKQLAAQEEMTTQAAFALPLVCVVNPGACVVVGIGILRVCKTAINVIKQLNKANIAHETYSCAAGGSCPVPAPTADSLTIAHKDAAGDRTKPGYGGQCKPDEHDNLKSKQDQACSVASSKGGCNRASGSGVITIDVDKANAWDNCAAARDNVANSCFMGGDNNHKNEVRKAKDAAEQCRTGIKQ